MPRVNKNNSTIYSIYYSVEADYRQRPEYYNFVDSLSFKRQNGNFDLTRSWLIDDENHDTKDRLLESLL